MDDLADGLVRQLAAARALYAGDQKLKDAHKDDLVGGGVGHLEAAKGGRVDDRDDRARLIRRVEREQAGAEEGAHRAESALRHDARGIFLPNRL